MNLLHVFFQFFFFSPLHSTALYAYDYDTHNQLMGIQKNNMLLLVVFSDKDQLKI